MLVMDPDEFEMQAVIVPYLPLDWEILYQSKLPSGWPVPPRRNAENETHLGNTIYVRTTFDFHNLRVVNWQPSIEPEALHADIGTAWVKQGAAKDPDTGILNQVLNTECQEGAYTYYPRRRGEYPGLPDMQIVDAENHAGMFAQLPFSARELIVRELCKAEFNSANSFSKGKRPNQACPPRLACSLAASCRLLNAEVKRFRFLNNAFAFYNSAQLNRFLGCIKPTTVLLSSWPRTFRMIILDVGSRSSQTLRQLFKTVYIPLGQNKHNKPIPRSENKNANYALRNWTLELEETLSGLRTCLPAKTEEQRRKDQEERVKNRKVDRLRWLESTDVLFNTYKVQKLIIIYDQGAAKHKVNVFKHANESTVYKFLDSIL